MCFGFGITMYAFIAIAKSTYATGALKNPIPCPICFMPSTLIRVFKSSAWGEDKDHQGSLYFLFGAYSSALILCVAVICFVLSFFQIPIGDYADDRLHYFELLFWGGGHILQFVFTQVLMTAWFYLIAAMGTNLKYSDKYLLIILIVNLLCALPAPLFYWF